MNEQGTYTASSGRAIHLIGLRMRRTWQGLLEGTPEQGTERRRRNGYSELIQQMHEEFIPAQAAIVIDEGWEAFPRFQWMALFEGPAIRSKDADWESRLCVCWFTSEIPSDLDGVIARVSAKLSWEDVAEDFDATW